MAKPKKAKSLKVIAGEFYAVKDAGILKCTKAPDAKHVAVFNRSILAPLANVEGPSDFDEYKEFREKKMKDAAFPSPTSSISHAATKFLAGQPEDVSMEDVVRHFLAMDKSQLDAEQELWGELFRLAEIAGLYYKVHDLVAFVKAGAKKTIAA